ncbi:MAG: hypothetical protein NTV46_11140, partial [Verrucomicrobia bacterium]|nr:hypothetical protein [Verrucomicrobiota bacterium]
QLCLIGSAVCLLGNMPERVSRDLDIWKPASTYDTVELKTAAAHAGILFNPKDYLEPGEPYLKIVEPGIVQTGKFVPVLMERMGRLELYRPPIENIIASKLTRADAKDIEDIQFLHNHYQPDLPTIKKIISAFPKQKRSIRCG